MLTVSFHSLRNYFEMNDLEKVWHESVELNKNSQGSTCTGLLVWEWEQPIFPSVGQWGNYPDLFAGCHVNSTQNK